MMRELRHVEWEDLTEAIPAFFTILFMPLTYTISNGLFFGILSYVVLKMISGRFKEVSAPLYVIAVLIVLKFIFL